MKLLRILFFSYRCFLLLLLFFRRTRNIYLCVVFSFYMCAQYSVLNYENYDQTTNLTFFLLQDNDSGHNIHKNNKYNNNIEDGGVKIVMEVVSFYYHFSTGGFNFFSN